MSKRFIIIDGNSLLFRAYYATAYAGTDKIMRTKSGIPTNAIFAFSNMIIKIINELKSDDHVFIAFDTGEKTFRHDEYDEYKAGRQRVPEELITQFPISREMLDAISIKHGEIVGYEADDIAGSLARKAESEGYTVEIYTSDHDYLQLISENITVKLIRKGLSDVQVLTDKTLFDVFGFYPYQVCDYKGLTGDASDNLKGIPGVGKVTALKLLAEYGSLENILENAANIKGKLGENIREHAEVARKSKYLATLITDVPVPHPLDYYLYQGYDSVNVQQFSYKYEMNNLVNKLKYNFQRSTVEVSEKTITSTSELENNKIFSLAFYISAKDSNYYQAKPDKMYFAMDDNVFVMTFDEALNDKKIISWLENPGIVKYSYDLKRAAIILHNHGINLQGEFNDVSIISYVTDTNIANNIPALLSSYGINTATDDNEEYVTLVSNIVNIYSEGLKKLETENAFDVYNSIEKPLQKVLIKMEIEGFDVDSSVLKNIGEDYRVIHDELSQKIYAEAGHEFNINSPQQVAIVLFDELGLPANKKRSTAVDVLNDLVGRHSIITLILEYRKYQKIISTYIDGLLPHIYEDGKVHSSFNQTLTTTGRLSSTNPNLQNISVRNEEGREVRKAFYAKDRQILAIDYSQIELRLLACIASVESLIDVFNHDRDIHTETAMRLFPLEDIDFARRKAKAVNFGIVYGISDFGLSEQLEISVPEARSIIKAFFDAYPEIMQYRLQIINDVQKYGYVKTITGRKRYIPEINDANYQIREFGKRAAMNAPIQGSAADLIKLAMIKVDEYLTNNKLKTKLILQVHDELIFALDNDEHHIIDEIVTIMEKIFELPLKLKVGVSVGTNWFLAS